MGNDMSIVHKSAVKGFKSVDLNMIAMARCIASYLCYLHARKGTTIFYEYLLRIPIVEIAQSYKWDYKAEYPLKDNGLKKGPYKKIDYVFAYNDQVVGIEIKFPKPQNPQLKMVEDIEKLRGLFIDQEAIAKFPHKYGYLMIAYEENIKKKIKRNYVAGGNSLKDEDMTKEGGIYRKRNILSVNDEFITTCRMGNCCYCVDVIKILERHDKANK